uniref:Uncharacterized protein n=1 Tax=viral metagenome TaxID=1070528 RepID=A0A6C0BNQ8_9ZZZZ
MILEVGGFKLDMTRSHVYIITGRPQLWESLDLRNLEIVDKDANLTYSTYPYLLCPDYLVGYPLDLPKGILPPDLWMLVQSYLLWDTIYGNIQVYIDRWGPILYVRNYYPELRYLLYDHWVQDEEKLNLLKQCRRKKIRFIPIRSLFNDVEMVPLLNPKISK